MFLVERSAQLRSYVRGCAADLRAYLPHCTHTQMRNSTCYTSKSRTTCEFCHLTNSCEIAYTKLLRSLPTCSGCHFDPARGKSVTFIIKYDQLQKIRNAVLWRGATGLSLSRSAGIPSYLSSFLPFQRASCSQGCEATELRRSRAAQPFGKALGAPRTLLAAAW